MNGKRLRVRELLSLFMILSPAPMQGLVVWPGPVHRFRLNPSDSTTFLAYGQELRSPVACHCEWVDRGDAMLEPMASR